MVFDSRQSIIAAILVLFLGKYLKRKIGFFRTYNIPEPVVGGFVASLFFGLIYWIFNIEIEFSTHYRDILLLVFFTSIGLSTDIKNIIKGGKVLLIITVLAILFIFVQNIIGVTLSRLFNLKEITGIIAGSVPLQGGHGNVVSFGTIINEKFKLYNAMEIGMLMATFGLIAGGILGGPVAKYLIKRHKLKPEDEEDKQITIGSKYGENPVIDYDSILKVLLMLSISIGIGIYLHELLNYVHFTLPLFATCMLGGLIVINSVPYIVPKLKCPAQSPTLAITSDISLGLFLAMAMMSLKFWSIGDEALFIITNTVIQTAVIILYTVFIIFRLAGKNYTAAVLSAGYIGSALGATPTAMANMAAVTKEYGPSKIAFMVIPILGAFIIQVSNAVIVNLFIKLMN